MPASDTRRRFGSSRAGSWPRSTGIPESSIRASASLSRTSRDRLRRDSLRRNGWNRMALDERLCFTCRHSNDRPGYVWTRLVRCTATFLRLIVQRMETVSAPPITGLVAKAEERSALQTSGVGYVVTELWSLARWATKLCHQRATLQCRELPGPSALNRQHPNQMD